MPRPKKASRPAVPEKTLVIDNGAYSIKAGYAPASLGSLSSASDPDLLSSACSTIPNCLAKLPNSKTTFVGAQLGQCRDFAEMVFRRPVQKGQLVNWEAEREIWCSSFFDVDDAAGGVVVPCPDPKETNLLLTEAPNSLSLLQSNADQVVFEEFEFAGYRRVPGPVLDAYCDVAGIMGDVDRQAEPGNEEDEEKRKKGEEPAEANTDEKAAETKTLGKGLATTECVLVVDSGYSHTTVTPVWRGRIIQQAARRLDIGGKFLTNYLKELLSLRQLDLTHEFHIVNEIKEDVCYVTSDLNDDLERTWKQGPRYEGRVMRKQQSKTEGDGMDVDDGGEDQSPSSPSSPTPSSKGIVLDYVMPDYTSRFRGEARPHDPLSSKVQSKLKQLGGAQDTVVTLGSERFAVPELLFSPSDIGMAQAGLAEVIMQSVRAMPPGIWSAMLSNVVVVGGNSKIPGFIDRLYSELRPLVPVEVMVRVKQAPDPEKSTWLGGARLAAGAKEKGLLKELFVTREEYQEYGEQWVMRQFAGEKPLPW